MIISKTGGLNKRIKVLLKREEVIEWINSKTLHIEDATPLERAVVIRDNIASLKCVCCENRKRFIESPPKFKLTCDSPVCNRKVRKKPECDYTIRASKISAALTRTVDGDLTAAQKAAVQANETKRQRGIMPRTDHLHTAAVRNKISASLKTSEVFKHAIAEARRRMIETGKDRIARQKAKQTMISKGLWADKNDTEWLQYRREVRRVTALQPISTLENYALRGRGSGKYHLDHIVSQITGFRHQIPAEKIGHISNLRFILEGENCKKQGRNTFEQIQSLLDN